MNDYKLHFNFKDIFLAPRLALSPRKIWVLIIGNLYGYIIYWIASYISLALSGMEINQAISDYGLYPFLHGTSAPLMSWIIYYVGIIIWLCFIMISSTSVSKITIKQLRGDNFFSANDAFEYASRKWKSVLFSPLSIILIISTFIFLACIFALFGNIPIIGQFTVPLIYVLYFFGAIFTIFSFLVLISTLLLSPAIIGSYDEDTVGSVFLSYQITFNQFWRMIIYNCLLFPISIIFTKILSWFYTISYDIINQIFGFFMGSKFENIIGYASSIVNVGWLKNSAFDININIQDDLIGTFNAASDLIELLLNLLNVLFRQFLQSFPNFSFDFYNESLSTIDTIAGTLLSVPLIFIVLSVLSYGIAIIAVGQTIIFAIFKMKMDNENIIYNNYEKAPENHQTNQIDDLNKSSHRVLSSVEEE